MLCTVPFRSYAKGWHNCANTWFSINHDSSHIVGKCQGLNYFIQYNAAVIKDPLEQKAWLRGLLGCSRSLTELHKGSRFITVLHGIPPGHLKHLALPNFGVFALVIEDQLRTLVALQSETRYLMKELDMATSGY